MNTPRLLALDGTNLLYRSYHALSSSGLSYAGKPVWAAHGLVLQIAKMLDAVDPDYLVVAFDTAEGCPSRRALDPGYKATRNTPPADLAQQLTWTPSVLRQAGLHVVDSKEWEADDVIASAVAQAKALNWVSTIVTSDRDAYQLLGPTVDVRTPDGKTITETSLLAEYGVSPSGYALLAALRGEPSDNLPGIPGVGAKTAGRLAARYESFDALESATDADLREILGPKTLESLRRDLPVARRTHAVARLHSGLGVSVTAGAMHSCDPDAAYRALNACGLSAAAGRLADSLRARRTDQVAP